MKNSTNPLNNSLSCQQIKILARKVAKAAADAKVTRIRRASHDSFDLLVDVEVLSGQAPVTVKVTAAALRRATESAQS